MIKPLLVLGFAAYFTYLIASGNLANYINLRFMPLIYIAAVLLYGLAAVGLISALRARIGGHSHQQVALSALAIMAVPLLIGVLVPSRPLGASAAEGSFASGANARARTSELPTNTRDWNVLDWLQAFYSANDATELEGQEASVIGFVHREEGFPEGHFMAARFMLSCCVADGQFVGLPVAWDGAEALPSDTWVRVTGRITVREFMGEARPVIQASVVDDTVGVPERPYLYP